jgi:multidrug resistance protein, MATE family
MQCQGKMQVPTYALLFCAPLNAILTYALVWRTSLRFIGAPIATVITHWTMAISMMIYAAFYGSKEAWPGWSWKIFSDWKSWKYMLHLAGSGIIMLCSEIWSWEIVILSSSFLGVKSLAANSVLLVFHYSLVDAVYHVNYNPNSDCGSNCDFRANWASVGCRPALCRKKSKPR